MKKNAFTLVELLAIIVIMASMLLIILPSINNTIKNSEEAKKQEALNSIYMAAENYVMANYDEYSSLDNIGAIEYVYIMDLINNGYLSIDTVNPNNDSVFNSKDVVKVTKQENGTFKFELDYIKTLIELLLEQYDVSNTTGLVKDETNPNLYYYTGTNEEVSNNFLWYGGHQWRVLEFDTEADTLTLITQQPLTAIQPASSIWTTRETYESSYINNWLNDYFWDSLDSSIQENILDSTFNVGIYTDVDEITVTQKVGLLDATQYDKSKKDDSFLNIENIFQLGNRYDSSGVCYINDTGDYNNNTLNGTGFGVRPVIKIKNIIIFGGDGNLTDSYRTKNTSTNTSDVQTGEYINVPYSGSDNACGSDNMCTFRVISKDNDGVKVILNGIIPYLSQWADNTNDTLKTSDIVYTQLNNFANGINSTIRYTNNKDFGVGDYFAGYDYTNAQSIMLSANVGLVTVGEMFSGNDLHLGANNASEFVNVSSIENGNFYDGYWLMNRILSVSVRYLYPLGNLDGNLPNQQGGIRPVIYLKNNLQFTGGNGTAQNPYTLN